MKKKAFIYTILASSLFIGILSSCDEKILNPTSSQFSTNIQNGTSGISNSQTIKYNLEDNETSKMVFDEFKKSFSEINYNDFLLKGEKNISNNEIRFFYMSSTIYLDLNGSFISKAIDINNVVTSFKYLNNEWLKVTEWIISDKIYYTYRLIFNSDWTINFIEETTYDDNYNISNMLITRYENNELSEKEEIKYDNGDKSTKTCYEYKDEGWVKNKDYIYINDVEKCIYSVNDIGTSIIIEETTYDELGNILTDILTEYIDNEIINKTKNILSYDDKGNNLSNIYLEYENDEWVYKGKMEYTYDDSNNRLISSNYVYLNNEWVKTKSYLKNWQKLIYSLKMDNDGNFLSKTEWTCDDENNYLTKLEYKYLNNEWVLWNNYVYINGEEKCIYSLKFGSYYEYEKFEYRYDNRGNELEKIVSVYDGNSWSYYDKYEYTYDDDNHLLEGIYSSYSDDTWAYYGKNEYEYDNKGKVLVDIYSYYDNGTWVYSHKSVYNYNEDVTDFTETYYKYENGSWVIVNI